MSQPIEGIFIQTTQAEQKQQEKTANILLLVNLKNLHHFLVFARLSRHEL